MKNCKLVLVGLGGYGNHYVGLLSEDVDKSLYTLAGVVDPFAKTAPGYSKMVEAGVPIYDTLEAFYAENTADLAIVSTPIPLHKEHATTALAHGSHVLCEKPIAPTLQEARKMEASAVKYGRTLAIGFQWSFSPAILKLKEDMSKGDFGKPLKLYSMVSWPRGLSYYRGSWKGCVKTRDGGWILDSVLSNATAHYLHNMLFVLGDSYDTSAELVTAKASLYRANDIESFDTCFLRGETAKGVEVLFAVAHPTYVNRNPKFRYVFENAEVTINTEDDTSIITAKFKDGTVREYGDPLNEAYRAAKLTMSIKAATEGAPVPCVTKTVLPHLRLSNALFDQVAISNFPKDIVKLDPARELVYAEGLYETLEEVFKTGKLPSELGLAWAVPETELSLSGYDAFEGKKFK